MSPSPNVLMITLVFIDPSLLATLFITARVWCKVPSTPRLTYTNSTDMLREDDSKGEFEIKSRAVVKPRLWLVHSEEKVQLPLIFRQKEEISSAFYDAIKFNLSSLYFITYFLCLEAYHQFIFLFSTTDIEHL